MILDYKFKNNALFKAALTHPSLAKNHLVESYERLEFLGDNVINLILATEVFKKFPHMPEGKLSQIHANLVKNDTLAEIATDLNLGEALILDIGEEKNNGRTNRNNLENTLEALIGAVFLDSDFENCKKIFLPLWKKFLENDNFLMQRDPKSLLQEWLQKQGKPIPRYRISSVSGSAHQKTFVIKLSIPPYGVVTGSGSSIKAAELATAKLFLAKLEITL